MGNSRFHRKYFGELEGFARGVQKVIDTTPSVHGGICAADDGAVDKVRAAQEKRARKAAQRAKAIPARAPVEAPPDAST